MEEFDILYSIPKSIFYEKVNYEDYAENLKEHHDLDSRAKCMKLCFKLYCYPNGENKGSHGYISLMFEDLMKINSEGYVLYVTLSLKDSEGKLRFPQSLAVAFTGKEKLFKKKENMKFGITKYIKLNSLVDSDIFVEDHLYVQGEVLIRSAVISRNEQLSYMDANGNFNLAECMFCILDSRHRFWKILGEKSEFIKKVVEYNTKLGFSFKRKHDRALRLIVESVLNEKNLTLKNLDDAFHLYKFADYTLLYEIKQNCSAYLKSHMDTDSVMYTIIFADKYNDKNLKQFAIDYALNYWDNKDVLSSFHAFEKLRPDLVQEINSYKNSNASK